MFSDFTRLRGKNNIMSQVTCHQQTKGSAVLLYTVHMSSLLHLDAT